MGSQAPGGRWYFGVTCFGCSGFVPIGPDPSDGLATAAYSRSGTVIAACTRCGRRGGYPASHVGRRRVDVPEARFRRPA